MIESYLRSKVSRPLPAVYADILDETGGVRRPGKGGQEFLLDLRCIYTADASSECIWHNGKATILIDFRFVDFVLELVGAFEFDEQLQNVAVFFTFYSLVIEQTLRHPECAFQKGAVLDYLVSRATASTHFDLNKIGHDDPGRIEYVAKLVVSHELAHAWLQVDRDYLSNIFSLFEAEANHIRSVAEDTPSGNRNPVFIAANIAYRLIVDYKHSGNLSIGLEEMLCDYVMVRAGSEAAVVTEQRQSRIGTYLTLAFSTLTALWAVPTIQKAMKGATTFSTYRNIDLDPKELREGRAVMALMTFLRVAGLGLGDVGKAEGGNIAKAWEETSDFDSVCAATINELLGVKNLQRLAMVGESASAFGMDSCKGFRHAILSMRGWLDI